RRAPRPAPVPFPGPAWAGPRRRASRAVPRPCTARLSFARLRAAIITRRRALPGPGYGATIPRDPRVQRRKGGWHGRNRSSDDAGEVRRVLEARGRNRGRQRDPRGRDRADRTAVLRRGIF